MDEVANTGEILAKIRPSSRLLGLGDRADLEPLYEGPAGPSAFGIDAGPQWFKLKLDEQASPWDSAHSQVAGQLGIDASDVIFAEPDIIHPYFHEGEAEGSVIGEGGFGVGEKCEPIAQDSSDGKPTRSQDGWHLGPRFSQLEKARDMVTFSGDRTRIAHLDTGYYPQHETTPQHIDEVWQRNFVEDNESAVDPGKKLLDNSGHGTGTIGVLAGGHSSELDKRIGGAPDAEIVPVRVASRVVLLKTSSLARAINHAVRAGCAVSTLSMGGLPTQAWADAVDDAYMAGLCMVAAAGNRVSISPPKTMVYPARYERVIAVTGAMANKRPYRKLKGKALEGSFGPKKAMEWAMAAYTPNIPWPKFGCEKITRFNGEGTSSATPQVAAAAALWIEKYKSVLRSDWRRVEAVRWALFESALDRDDKYFGHGILQAADALEIAPNFDRSPAGKSKNSWAFLRLLTGLGIQEETPTEQMFNLELAQLWMLDDDMQAAAPDPEGTLELDDEDFKAFMEAVMENPQASQALRDHLDSRYRLVTGLSYEASPKMRAMTPELPDVSDGAPEILDPPSRRLQVYAKDPSLLLELETLQVGEVTIDVPWEELTSPRRYAVAGEYLEIDDAHVGRRGGYDAVDLNDPRLLATNGWKPSEGNPQFHQQMVYGVAMKTIQHFERALGRPVQWRPRPVPGDPFDDSQFVPQLTIRPHAMRAANAYYSPNDVALLFGYYGAPAGGLQIPNSPVYTCLAHDIVAHETTHAILDGMYRRFNQPTNVDVLALHEGFADIVALLQQFSMPELLYHEIMQSEGDLEAETMLGKLAIQVGAKRGAGALRSAIGSLDADGRWVRSKPDPSALETTTTPHARGAILVAAVFDALLAIYESRTEDLLRIASGGTGILPRGAIHPDLAHRLADEAAKAAQHVLTMCIRALDYLPPVDVTFFDYLRALITADFEIESADRYNYRVAFVEAFARRGLFPGDHDEQVSEGPRALSADTLRWPSFDRNQLTRTQRSSVMPSYEKIVEMLKDYADQCLYIEDRKELFDKTRRHRAELHGRLRAAFRDVPEFAESLGLDPQDGFEVHTLRRAMRSRPGGGVAPQVIVSLTQSRQMPDQPKHRFHGGSTLVVDLTKPTYPKYRIVKRITDQRRMAASGAFGADIDADPLRGLFLSASEPFAALHEISDHR